MPQFLRFELAGRHFALHSEVVREVTRAVAITPLPKAPVIVEGLINVRGELVPVLDIRARFGLPPNGLSPEQHFIVAGAGRRTVALRVDRALDVLAVDQASVQKGSAVAPGAQLVAGIVTLPDGLLVIHDLERFLSLDEAREVDAAVAALAGRVPPPENQ